jgi:hypothetical protein
MAHKMNNLTFEQALLYIIYIGTLNVNLTSFVSSHADRLELLASEIDLGVGGKGNGSALYRSDGS